MAVFFEKVIKAFSKKKEWNIIISTGEVCPSELNYNYPNVYIFKRVPQLEILKYVKVAIIHGGVNTILECITHLKPMLAFAYDKNWDQFGNVSRLVYYGLGLAGNFNSFSINDLLNKLTDLIQNPIYTDNIKKMRKKILEEDGMDRSIELIKNFLSDKNASSG